MTRASRPYRNTKEVLSVEPYIAAVEKASKPPLVVLMAALEEAPAKSPKSMAAKCGRGQNRHGPGMGAHYRLQLQTRSDQCFFSTSTRGRCRTYHRLGQVCFR